MYDLNKCKNFLEELGFLIRIDKDDNMDMDINSYYDESFVTVYLNLNRIVKRLNGKLFELEEAEDAIATLLQLNKDKLQKDYSFDDIKNHCHDKWGLKVNGDRLESVDCDLSYVWETLNDDNIVRLNDVENLMYKILKKEL